VASENVLAQLESLVRQRPRNTTDDNTLLPDFVCAYFEHIREEQLGNRSAVELLAAAQAHFELAVQRTPQQPAVAVVPLAASQNGCDMAVMTAALLITAAELHWRGGVHALLAASVLIAAGSVLTCVLRSRAIAAQLRERG